MQTTEQKQCKLVCDIALFSGRDVLLVKYTDTNKYDHQSGWFLPDDLIQFNEHPEDAAKRILSEQLGMELSKKPELAFIESFTGNDKSWHLVFHFKADLDSKPEIKASENIAEHRWFDLMELPEKNDVAHRGWALYTIEAMNP
jgi:ADP-ribose pyrophosphatase YjhB (NUDIX family)